MRFQRLAVSALLIAGCSMGVFGQEKAISLDVVVTEKPGNAVTGLTEQNFTLLDNRQPQKITSFKAVEGKPSDSATIIIVLDEVNDSFSNVAYERSQLTKYFQQNVNEIPAPISLVFFTDTGATAPTAATTDSNTLIAALKANENPQHTIRRSQGFYGASDRVDLSLKTLEQLAAVETKQPGRKLVIWVSPGWPLLTGPNIELTQKNEQQIFNTIVSLSTELRAAQITLNAVDPLGTSDSGGLRTIYWQSFTKGAKNAGQVQLGNLGLQVIAFQSGGQVLNSSNDISKEISECASDLKDYYELTFDAASADGPNDYHSIEVKVDKPGAKVRTRTGYYAQP